MRKLRQREQTYGDGVLVLDDLVAADTGSSYADEPGQKAHLMQMATIWAVRTMVNTF